MNPVSRLIFTSNQINQGEQIRKHQDVESVSEKNGEPNSRFFLALLLGLVLLVAIIAGPQGNFPLNDDRLYGEAVRNLVEKGQFSIICSNAFDFIPIYFGWIVCEVTGGFSYETLRWTTIAFNLFGVAGLFAALRELNCSNKVSTLLSSAYAFNPFTTNLALSFMTDVPSLAFTNWSLFAALRAMKTNCIASWLTCVLLATAAVSVRQSALVFLAPFYICAFFSLRKPSEKALMIASAAIPIGAYLFLQKWLAEATQFAGSYDDFSAVLKNSLISIVLDPAGLLSSISQHFCYLGIFLAPLTLPLTILAFRKWKQNKIRLLVSVILSLTLIVVPLLLAQMKHNSFMPYSLNLFYPPILGCYALIGGVPVWKADHLKVFTYVCDIAAFLLFVNLSLATFLFTTTKETIKSDENTVPSTAFGILAKFDLEKIFLILMLVCVMAGLVVQLRAANLDRYFLLALAPLILYIAPLWNQLQVKRLLILSAVMTMALAVYGILTTNDCMNFTRGQWAATDKLESLGIASSRIDGGPSFVFLRGGLPLYLSYRHTETERGWPIETRGGAATGNLRWWPIVKDDYIVSTITLDGYHKMSEIKYWSPLFWKSKTILMLESNKLNSNSMSKDEFN